MTSSSAKTTAVIDLTSSQVKNYSEYPEVQAAFDRMVALSVKVATTLRAAEPGSVAVFNGYSYWVSETFKADEPMMVPAGEDCFETTLDEYPHFPSHCEGLGEDELNDISAEVEIWLTNPVFEKVDQSNLDAVSLKNAMAWSAPSADESGMQVLDFTQAQSGALVTRSEHWLLERCGAQEGQLGVMVERKFYLDSHNTLICWPVIHWEGEVMATICHPSNAAPYRDHELPFVLMVQ